MVLWKYPIITQNNNRKEKNGERERERERERYDTFCDCKPKAIISFFVPFFRKNETKYIFMEWVEWVMNLIE